MRFFSLTLLLACLWLLMSGHYNPLLLTLGGISVVFVVWLSARMGIVDREGVPIQHAIGMVPYAFWIVKEIVVSSLSVSKIVLAKKIEYKPEVFVLDGLEKDDVLQTFYANSITLTPGTVTIDSGEESLFVHALTKASADDLRSGKMQTRINRTRSKGSKGQEQ